MKERHIIIIVILIVSPFTVPNANGQWVKVSNTSIASVNAIVANGGVLLTGTASGFFTSTDSGSTWVASNSGLMPQSYFRFVTSIIADDSTLYAGVVGIYKSTDLGKHWTEINTNPYVESLCASGNLLLAGTAGYGVFRSTNGGVSWDSVNTDLPSNGYAFPVVFFGTKTFVDDYGGFYSSGDSGGTWSFGGPADMNVFLPVSSTLLAGGYGIFESTDTGLNWIQISPKLNPFDNVQSLAIFDTLIFAGMIGGVEMSTNNGMNWNNISAGLPDTSVNTLIASDGYLFAGTPVGIWRRPLSDFNQSSVSESTAANSNSSIQIFPNPASDELQIKCEQAGEVHLFDLMGRERMNAAMDGINTSIDVSNLEAGMYFLRLGNESAKVEITH
jgi:photosystem II stability/assembly factor-like uncharacterized protein